MQLIKIIPTHRNDVYLIKINLIRTAGGEKIANMYISSITPKLLYIFLGNRILRNCPGLDKYTSGRM